MKTFSPMEVILIIGITYRQLQYWDKSGFISPSVSQAGSYRQYSFRDLTLMYVAKTLRFKFANPKGKSLQKKKYSIQRIRNIITVIHRELWKFETNTEEIFIMVEGDRVMMSREEVIICSGPEYIQMCTSDLRAKATLVRFQLEREAAREAIAA